MTELVSAGSGQSAAMYSPASLAYLGDAVFELLVRARVTRENRTNAARLNSLSRQYVAAGSQSRLVEAIKDMLTDEETAVYLRGRNTKTHNVAKNAAVLDYRRATGLEALFGWLYLEGRTQRIEELFDAICSAHDGWESDGEEKED